MKNKRQVLSLKTLEKFDYGLYLTLPLSFSFFAAMTLNHISCNKLFQNISNISQYACQLSQNMEGTFVTVYTMTVYTM